MSDKDTFTAEVARQIDSAIRQGRPHAEINAGEIHRVVGEYPNPGKHTMPTLCDVMNGIQHSGVTSREIVYAPPKGKGASLTIRYNFN